MLAIKTLTATSRLGFSDAADRPPSPSAPGLIFDEVDAGIGGRVADVVGRKLRALGSAFQVLCITHLPQIAAYADTQFLIEKRVEGGRTRTTVQRLAVEGRVDELARMLGGEAITDGLRRSAREMLEAKAIETAKGESESGKRKRK
jgi:DNA repair protein RecN (Recombination protein N)